MKYHDSNRPPQRLAAAGVLLFLTLALGCQQAVPQAAKFGDGPDASPLREVAEGEGDGMHGLSSESCAKSEDGFASFFERFVQDRQVRAAHSAPMIALGGIANPSEGKAVSSEWIEPFRVGMVDNQWVYEEPGKPPENLARLDMSQTLKDDTMRVEFVRAEFSAEDEVIRTIGGPEAYVFAFRNGCWQLTEYLR